MHRRSLPNTLRRIAPCFWLPFALAVTACGGGAVPPTETAHPVANRPNPAPSAAQAQAALPPAAEGVPAAPAECAAFAQDTEAPSRPSCPGQQADFLHELRLALQLTSAHDRDQKLAAIEPCTSRPELMRALRAELAPVGCADVVIEGWLRVHPLETADSDVNSVLLGLAYSARLDRLVRQAPQLAPPFDEASFRDFLRSTLASWVMTQAHAIHQTALLGARLEGYGKGLVAISAGLADLRFADAMRSIPMPESLAADAELADEYRLALEQSLEPRMIRGRDAALVGLRKFAELGVLRDARLDQARALLSRLFAGRRINALDRLAFPQLEPLDLAEDEPWLAANLPSYYLEQWLGDSLSPEQPTFRALLARGVPPRLLAKQSAAPLPPEALHTVVRAHLALGQTYWNVPEIQRAADLSEGLLAHDRYRAEAELIRGVARALRGGPNDAAHMMARGPLLPGSVGDIAVLDELSKTPFPLAADAAFNSGLILALIPQVPPDPKYWDGIASRFDQAARLADGEDLRAQSRDYAAEARATATAIRQKLQSAPEGKPLTDNPRS